MNVTNGNGKEITTPLKEAQFQLGIKVLACRRRSGISQQELADRCNRLKLTTLVQQRVSEIENGTTEATFFELQAIADVFSRDLNEFRI